METLHLQGLAAGDTVAQTCMGDILAPLLAREGIDLAECDEKILLARSIGGDQAAFQRLVALHGPRITRLAYRLLGWSGDVDDVVQEVFIAALEHGHKFRGDNGLSPWLAAITLNICRSRIRRRFRLFNFLRSRQPAESHAPSADDTAIRDDTAKRVRTAVRALPARDREVVVLFYLEGRRSSEISQITGDSENAIDVRLHRARKRLKELLEGVM